MPDNQLGVQTTFRSHGVKVAKIHMHDWLILVLLIVLDAILNLINPFYRFVGEGMMTFLRYPMKANTIPFWAVPFIAILLPFAIFIIYYFIRRDVYDLHHATLGLLFSVLITAVLTDAIKDAVGAPRPDFFWRCFPDGKAVFDPVTRSVICTGVKSVIKEGHKAFPSGHTSWSFSGLGFLSWYLSGKVRVFDRRGHVAKLCVVFTPLLLAALVGVSRVDDYWHDWHHVVVGGLLGAIVASFCYLQFFPPPYDADGWGPHAYFQMLAETRDAVPSSSTNTNRLVVDMSNLTIALKYQQLIPGTLGPCWKAGGDTDSKRLERQSKEHAPLHIFFGINRMCACLEKKNQREPSSFFKTDLFWSCLAVNQSVFLFLGPDRPVEL